MLTRTTYSIDNSNQYFLPEDLTESLTEGQQTDHILLDFSKAFDKVNHLKLLYKLQVHGIQGKTLQWIQSFLVGRSKTVLQEGECLGEVPVSSGVSQDMGSDCISS